MRARVLLRHCVATLAAVVSGAACNGNLPAYSAFVDLRVLAMQANPPELQYTTPGPLSSTVEALVVDPRGGPLQYTWSLCPVESSEACDDFASQLSLQSATDQATLTALRAISATGTALPTPLAAGSGPHYVIPGFDISAAATSLYGNDTTDTLFAFYLQQSLLNQGQGAWPSVVLQLQSSHGDGLSAAKRVVLGVADFAQFAAPLAQRFGITVCPASGAAPPGCVSLPQSPPNTNPNFATVTVSPGPDAGGTFAPFSQPLPLKVGAQVRLRPSFTAASFETYEVLRANVQTRAIEVETITEELSVSWFVSDGSVSSDLTWPKFTKTLENVYTAPDAVPAHDGGVVSMVMVGRDQRGGEAWETILLQITP